MRKEKAREPKLLNHLKKGKGAMTLSCVSNDRCAELTAIPIPSFHFSRNSDWMVFEIGLSQFPQCSNVSNVFLCSSPFFPEVFFYEISGGGTRLLAVQTRLCVFSEVHLQVGRSSAGKW